MPADVSRRELVAILAALGFIAPGAAFADEIEEARAAQQAEMEARMAEMLDRLALGEPTPFSFDALVERARALAAAPYAVTPPRAADLLDRLGYSEHMQIRFDPTYDLPVGVNARVQGFHLGRFFKEPVGLNLVTGGEARALGYSESYFTMPEDSPAHALPDDIGFAGFRVVADGSRDEWVAFLGAAYFRSAGEFKQYGQSARAVAIDVAMPTPEEFPRFTDFWFEAKEGNGIVIYALMDGPRISGALKIDMTVAGPVTMDIDSRYFARADIERVGIAPLTSMFWFSETDRRLAVDWRPEIHDTDGLSMWTGAGERLWRPLNNPATVVTSSFTDPSVRGFGLLQRDRNFVNYEDSSALYDRRPGVWIEPLGDWGPGFVQLVEIPTDDEIHDNIVAYWVSDAPFTAGSEVAYAYRLHWVGEEPFPPETARVVATRRGKGGPAGQPSPKGYVKFVVDFEGGAISHLDDTYVMNSDVTRIEPVVTVSNGRAVTIHNFAVGKTGVWRGVFDLVPDRLEPVEMRMYLARNGEALTETWTYQYLPTELPDPVQAETTATP
jgi:glucans biosynthesis protein